MSKSLFFIPVLFLSITCLGQEFKPIIKKGDKGKFYFYWGWNRDHFSKSNMHFTGEEYDFTLSDVSAQDKPSKYNVMGYLNLTDVTIPQYNYRLGYQFTDKYSLSFGFDHMKYVMAQDQIVNINGNISNSNTAYDGIYNNEPIVLSENFLRLEHTDGLNYLNLELRRHEKIYKYGKLSLEFQGGIGAGMMVPRTDATLMGRRRHDEFHVAGYGLDGLIAARVFFANTFYAQSEFKVGYINMPNIRTTYSSRDKASQKFFFLQQIFVIGAQFGLFHVE